MFWGIIGIIFISAFIYALVASNEREPWEDEYQEKYMREWYESHKTDVQ